MIPIIILHHNEFEYLNKCVLSIEKNTKFKYKIFIVDNNSNLDCVKAIKKKFGKKYNIFFNKKDNWLLGFNIAIKQIKYNWKYIILTDADITFKKTKDKKCWLNYLYKEMENNLIIGKLGIRINTDYIKNKKIFKKIYLREKKYQNGEKINNHIIAPVDTTAAIYRKNIFIYDKFLLKVGHTSFMKPYYYSCRTGSKLECFHEGWKKYNYSLKQKNIIHIREKAYFFAKWNRPIEKTLSKKLNLYDQLICFFISKYSRIRFSIFFIYEWVKYIIKNFPFNYNAIQNKYNN